MAFSCIFMHVHCVKELSGLRSAVFFQEELQRIAAAEHLGSCLLEEQEAMEEEVYASELVEQEVLQRLEAELAAEEHSVQQRRLVVAQEADEALQPILEALEEEEQRKSRAVEAMEEAEEVVRRHGVEMQRGLERLEQRLVGRCTGVEEQLLAAKMRCMQRVAREEEEVRRFEEEAREEAEQHSRAAWEEIAALNLEKAQKGAEMRREEEEMKVEAQAACKSDSREMFILILSL